MPSLLQQMSTYVTIQKTRLNVIEAYILKHLRNSTDRKKHGFSGKYHACLCISLITVFPISWPDVIESAHYFSIRHAHQPGLTVGSLLIPVSHHIFRSIQYNRLNGHRIYPAFQWQMNGSPAPQMAQISEYNLCIFGYMLLFHQRYTWATSAP